MSATSPVLDAVKRPVVLIGALALIVVVVVWLLAFFVPQSHKLSALQTEKTSLQQQVVQDDARLQQLRTESHHVGQIQTLHSTLKGDVPAGEDLYPYIQTLSGAGNSAGVSISSLEPGTPATATGTPYTAIPITAQVKGTYDQLVAFIKDIYGLPRLTDINTISITGGGPGTNRSTTLSATLDLAIFTSQKVSTSS